jgi:hypothetical protein
MVRRAGESSVCFETLPWHGRYDQLETVGQRGVPNGVQSTLFARYGEVGDVVAASDPTHQWKGVPMSHPLNLQLVQVGGWV